MWSYGKGKSRKCGLMEKENQGNVVLWKRKIKEMWSLFAAVI